MDDQPKVLAQTASTFFYDGASMRQPVPGTVPIGGLKEDAAFFTGKGADGQFVATIPVAVDEAPPTTVLGLSVRLLGVGASTERTAAWVSS